MSEDKDPAGTRKTKKERRKEGVQLTQEEADALIAMIKNVVQNPIILPGRGVKHVNFDVVSRDGGRKFLIHPYASDTDPDKHQITALATGPTVRLMHLCIGGKKHRNPDGTIVGPNHLHIYREGDSDGYAVPVDVTDTDFAEDTILLLKKFHVVTDHVNVQRSLI